MVAKTIKLPAALDARLRREAHARRRSYSAVMRAAIVRGLDTGTGLNMAEALKDFIGSADGPADLSTNKNYFRDLGRKRAR